MRQSWWFEILFIGKYDSFISEMLAIYGHYGCILLVVQISLRGKQDCKSKHVKP